MAGRKTKSGYDGKIAGLYDLEETIGQGHFAVVKLARHVFTGEKVAVKVIDKQKLDDMSRSHLFQEVRCMKLVQHPNVVRLYEVIDTQTKLYLILELGDGDMYDYIMRHDSGLNEALAKKYFRQIVEAITYCHRLHVVHRDLKPENVVFFDKLGQVKLTDFGFSNVFAPGKKLETSCGSLAYSAPEILLGDSYDPPAVDVWSLGVILFMLVAGHAPFQEANDSETLTMIMDCKYQIPAHVSDLCRRLITKMLVREPSNRINLTDIEGDPWLSSEPDYENHRGISLPLLTREHISEDDHSYVVQKMVEGKICTRDEIYLSLEKNAYDHVAATYYLLVERRLRKLYQQQEMMMSAGHNNQANNSNRQLTNTGGTGSNMPSSAGSKPHLEPLMLSPRKRLGMKKTNTAPILKGLQRHHPPSLVISPPVISSEPGAVISPGGPEFVKSLTDSMTLDRHTANLKKKQHNLLELKKDHNSSSSGKNISNNNSSPGTYSPQSADGSPRNSALSLLCDIKKPPPQRVKSAPLTTQGGDKSVAPAKKKSQRPVFSKIAILSSFFERKAAETSGAVKPFQPHQRLLPRREKKSKTQPNLSPVSPSFQFLDIHRKRPPTAGGSGGLESKESNLVQSLLSPLGTHPSPVSGGPGMASPSKPMMHLSPADFVGMTRKCSLIHEESHEDEDDDFDMDPVIELKPSKSLELLDERVSDLSPCTSKELGIGPVDTSSKDLPMSTSASPSSSSPSSSSVNPRRPLKSVCSSPQLLNQIHEENESEDDDDFVPLKLSAPRGRYGHHHTGLASPEILRKYEQRRRRGGTGSRGTSCSSSDASDTDDTDGRSRKDKLKHKFVHRRDSSDHSSDTDGPSGNNSNGGGGGGGGSRISSGNGARAPGSRGGGGRGGNGSGGGGGNSGGGSSDKGGKGHNNNHHSRHHQNLSLNNRLNRCANTNIYNDSNTCESGMEKVFGISFSHHSLSSEENDMISPDLAEDDADHCNKEIKGNLLASLFSSHDDVDDDDEDDDTDLSKEDRRIPSHRKSSDINNSSDHRNSMNSLYSRNNNSSSSGSSYKHRRNHLARQKQIISSKNNEKEDEVVCGLSGTITDNIAMDISEKDIGIDLADFGSCLDDSLSIDLLASAIDCHRVAIEHDTADGRLCSSVKNERFDWMGKSELNNQENNKSNAGDNEKAINKNSDLIMTVVDPNNDITLNSTAAASSPLLTSNNYNDSDNNNGCNEDNISSNLGNHYEEYKNNNNNDNSNLIRISDYFNNVVVGTKTSPLPPPSSSSSSSSLFYNMEESTGVGGGGGVHFTDNGKLSYCTCNLLLKEGSNLVGGTTMSHIVDCEGSHLTLKCQQCASLAMDNTKNNNKNNNNNNNNNCLQPSSYCKAGPGSVMVQMESKCCSVV